jgi:hypothetical protein
MTARHIMPAMYPPFEVSTVALDVVATICADAGIEANAI